jgi:hypothetical protein
MTDDIRSKLRAADTLVRQHRYSEAHVIYER